MMVFSNKNMTVKVVAMFGIHENGCDVALIKLCDGQAFPYGVVRGFIYSKNKDVCMWKDEHPLFCQTYEGALEEYKDCL